MTCFKYNIFIFLLLTMFLLLILASRSLASPVPVYATDVQNYSTWMSDMSPEWKTTVKINDWIIPGTHDSVSGCLVAGNCKLTSPWYLVPPMHKRLCSTQHLNTLDQIRAGVRFFDIRFEFSNGNWYTNHGLCVFGLPLVDWAHSFLNYTKTHCPQEVFILDIRYDGKYANDATYKHKFELLNTLSNMFKPYQLSPSEINLDMTYTNITMGGNRLAFIIFMEEDFRDVKGVDHKFHDRKHYNSNYKPDVMNDTLLVEYIKSHIVDINHESTRPPSTPFQLRTTQAFLQQPDKFPTVVLHNILKANDGIPERMMGILFNAYEHGRRLNTNIVIMNGFDAHLTPLFIELNLKMVRVKQNVNNEQ